MFNSSGIFIKSAIFGNTSSDEFTQGVVVLPNGDVICSGRPDSKALLIKFCDFDSSSVTSSNDINLVKNDFKIYPNPTNDFVNLDYNLAKLSDVKISIYNLMGELIKYYSIKPETVGKQHFQINTYDLKESGAFFINFLSGDTSLSQKLIILK